MSDTETRAELVAVSDPAVADDVVQGRASYADVTERAAELRPIIPPSLRPENIRSTARLAAKRQAHKTALHASRSPKYLAVYLWHALRGAATGSARLFHLVLWTEGWGLESRAAAAGRPAHLHQMSAHTQGLKTRGQRLRITGICLLLVAAGLLAMYRYAPAWGWAVLAVVVVAALAQHGKRPGERIVQPAVIGSGLEKLTPDIIVRALGSMSLSGIDKVLREGREIAFVTPVQRDGPGWRVTFDLPYGVTALEFIERRDKFAAGLRRPAGCVWPEGEADDHPGRITLYVCDEPLGKMRQPAWPLAKAGKADIFQPLPFGTDQRGKPVVVELMFANLLIGAISRMGKTVALRNVLLAAALDPMTELHVHELKGTGDLKALERVAHAYGSGADDETLEACLADLRKVHAELDRRAKVIKELPRDVCPDSKVTPQLAARRSLALHPIVLGIDECQEEFSHPDFKDEFERLCLQLIRRGPALGIMLVLATQRPDAKALPTAIRANIAMRFCLKVMDSDSNNMILGAGAYNRGINATLLAFSDKGVGWAVGFADAPMILKAYNLNGQDADRICVRARAAREALGLLTGFAAGELDHERPRDVLGDVAAMFAGEAGLHWTVLADRLAARLPDTWADVTADAISAQCRGLDVPSVLVKMDGTPLRGCRLDDVRKALEA